MLYTYNYSSVKQLDPSAWQHRNCSAKQVKAETAEARRLLRDVEARHAELTRVEAALTEVRDLFTQLAHLVASQQDQVDSVEYYALQATEHVGTGGGHLLNYYFTIIKTI